MKFVVFACLLAVAVARPDYNPTQTRHVDEPEKILRNEQHHGEGQYSSDFETEGGISIQESGSRLEHVDEQPVGQQGEVRFTLPNGEQFELKFVADENGYQPESPFLPVAPAFPHPIPQFVLDQIEKAAREDKENADDQYKPPAQTYDF